MMDFLQRQRIYNLKNVILLSVIGVFSNYVNAENNGITDFIEMPRPGLQSINEIKNLLGVDGELLSKSYSGAAFAPLYGGGVSLLQGCVVNRPPFSSPIPEPDLDMYSSISLPVGATIVGISAYFLDLAHFYDDRPSIILQRHNGLGDLTELTVAQSPEIFNDFPGFYEITAEIDSPHVVENDDFFNMIFTTARGDTQIINAYWICGVRVHYQMNQ